MSSMPIKSRIVMSTRFVCEVWIGIALLFNAQGAWSAEFNAPASFRITSDVVNRDVGAFTATYSSGGNALLSYSFEPCHFRTRFWATGDAANEILLNANDVTGYNSYREGFFDGAEVRVYRPMNGKIQLVRSDRVAQGGSRMSGFNAFLGSEKELISPQVTEAEFRFDGWNRPNVPYYFALVAVDQSGRESPPSAAVLVTSKISKSAIPPVNIFVKPTFSKPTGSPTALAVPAGLSVEYISESQLYRFHWKPMEQVDLAGYRLVCSDYEPSRHRGYGLQLTGKASSVAEQIKKGDWIFVAKEFRDFSRNKYLSNRVWDAIGPRNMLMPRGIDFQCDENPAINFTLDAYGSDRPVPDGGETALKVSLKEGGVFTSAMYNHASTSQTWYEVLDPSREYVVEFWARQQGMGEPTMRFFFTGPFAKKIPPMVFTLTNQWQKHTAKFKVTELLTGNTSVGQMVFEAKGPGTLWLDNMRVYAADAPFMDFDTRQYDAIKASGMSMIRTHAFIKTNVTSYSMDQFTNPAGVINGVHSGNTLPQTLSYMRRAGVNPWLQVEMHMSPEEWLGFVEYLAAPYDPNIDSPKTKPWAAKRYAQGHAKPWSDDFDNILFEISNETWNWLFQPWVFEAMSDGVTDAKYDRGEIYGMFTEHVYECMAKSPYWTMSGLDKKMKVVLGGWAINNNQYGNSAATHCPHATYNTVAAYNGGWDEGEGPTTGDRESLARTLMQVAHIGTDRSMELLKTRENLKKTGKANFELGTYEGGPGYALSGLNGQTQMPLELVLSQERTMKSLSAGTATLDCFLDKAYYGHKIQNYFTLHFGGTHWVSHAPWYKGYVAYPSWMVMGLYNTQGTGSFLRTQTLSVPGMDAPKYKRRPAKMNVPLVACYATHKADRVNVFVLSRKVDHYPNVQDDGFTPVTIELPFDRVSSITLYRMTGDPSAHNLDGEKVKIETVTLSPTQFAPSFTLNAARGADDRGLPAASTFLYVFQGTNLSEGKDVLPEISEAKSAAK